MLLLEVQLKNFKSYAEETAPLGGLSMAAVMGMNGAGKSSLIDAILYALYGKTAKDVPAENLMRDADGVTDMSVSLTFELDGQVYRVQRGRNAKGAGVLEFQREVTPGRWESATGDSKKETQAKIVEIIGADFETFIASSFVLQGRADEFTKKGPADRKRVLYEVLGLTRYDRLASAAREEREQAKRDAADCRRRKAEAEAEAAQEGSVRASLEAARATLDAARESVNTVNRELDAVTEELSGVEKDLARDRDLEQQITAKEQESRNIESDIEAAKGRQQTAEQRSQAAQDGIDRAQKITAKGPAIRAKVEEREEKDRELAAMQERADLDRTLRQDLSRAREARATWESEHQSALSRVRANLENARKAAGLLESDFGCDSPTKGAGCRFLVSAYEAREQISDLQMELSLLEQEQPDGDASRVEELEQQIKSLGYSPEAQRALQAEIQELAKWTRLLPELEAAEVTIREKTQAKAQADADAQRALDEQQTLQKRKGVIAADIQRLKDERSRLEPLRQKKSQLQSRREGLKQRLEQEQSAVQNAAADVGRLEERLDAVLKAIPEAERLAGELVALERKVLIYSTLVDAFSPAGVPALIIENALPELERMVNETLARLTAGEMALEFRTQRASKSSDTLQETLDIVVSSKGRTRLYETFSGGEAFRIDFAIRVALARLMAHRAGATIQCLWIDEGIGTQDPKGRKALMECIQLIRADFRQVFLITHVDEVKDAFPNRLEVTKDESGSHLRVA